MEIITGYVGAPHVTSEQGRMENQGIYGEDSYVTTVGMQMEPEVASNNEIRIRDGLVVHQGCAGSIKKNTYDSVFIANGSQGMERIDLIVLRYEKDNISEIESLDWEVIQGNAVAENPVVPDHVSGNIQDGDYVSDMPFCEVRISGLNIISVTKVFETVGNFKELEDRLAELNGRLEDFLVITKQNQAFSLNANGYASITFTPNVIDGYKCLGLITGGCSSNASCVMCKIDFLSKTIMFRNIANAQMNGLTAEAFLLYVKDF